MPSAAAEVRTATVYGAGMDGHLLKHSQQPGQHQA